MIAGVQLTNILSELVDNRIYPDLAIELDPDKEVETPYIVYQDVSNVPTITLDGTTGHEWVRMQIDVYHHDKYEGVLLANRVIQLINDNIRPSVYDGKQSMRDDKHYRQSIDYEFWQTADTE